MENLVARYEACAKALKALQDSLNVMNNPEFSKVHKQLRDSVIQCFEFSIDTLWKLLKAYLAEKHNVDFPTAGPKAVARESLNQGIITQEMYTQFLELIDDRNITSHTYNEELAQEISQKIVLYHQLMQSILNNLNI